MSMCSRSLPGVTPGHCEIAGGRHRDAGRDDRLCRLPQRRAGASSAMTVGRGGSRPQRWARYPNKEADGSLDVSLSGSRGRNACLRRAPRAVMALDTPCMGTSRMRRGLAGKSWPDRPPRRFCRKRSPFTPVRSRRSINASRRRRADSGTCAPAWWRAFRGAARCRDARDRRQDV